MGYIIGNRIQSGSGKVVSGAKPVDQTVITVPSLNFKGVAQTVRAASLSRSGSADVSRTAPTFNDPRYTASTLAIPTDDRTLNGLYRFFDDTDPIVGSSIRLHTELPLSATTLGDCGDPGVQKHFEEMWSRIQGDRLLGDIVSEYWRIGTVSSFGAWNNQDFMWDQFAVLNPDYVKIDSTWLNQVPLVKLQPDAALKRLVDTMSPLYLYQQLPPEIIRYVRLGQEIPLDPNNVFVTAHNKSPYEQYGKSIIKRILKLLMYEDRLQQAQFAIATRHVIPLTVFKVGDPSTGWVPDQSEIDDLREMVAAWELDPNFSIFYHFGLNVEFYGSSGKILQTGPEFTRIQKLKFIGMGLSETLLMGSGTYASAYATLEVMRQRYLSLQIKLKQLVEQGWFRPVAEACGFYKSDKVVTGAHYSGKAYGSAQREAAVNYLSQFTNLRDFKDNEDFKKMVVAKTANEKGFAKTVEFVYPKVDFGYTSVAADQAYKQWLLTLKSKFPWMVSERTISRVSNLDHDDEKSQFMKEAKAQAKMQQELASLGVTVGSPGGPGGDMLGGAPLPMEGGQGGEMPTPIGGGEEAPLDLGPEEGAMEAPPPPAEASVNAMTKTGEQLLDVLESEITQELLSEI